MMLHSMPRSGVSEMDQRASPSSLRTNRAMLLNSSKSSRSLERKTSTKIASFPEKRNEGYVQEEQIKAREEKVRAPEEHREMKRVPPSMRGESEILSHNDARIKLLEGEVNRVKDSESKMLESLMSQTKQLEETKIELEEAKLEIRALQETIGDLGSPACSSSRNLEKHLEKSNDFDPVRAQEEVARLKNELKLALGAEEKSKKAMDDLAAALKEVAAEANQVKEKHLVAQTELLDTIAGAEYTKTTLKSTEEKLRLALEEVQRLKVEAEESTLAWNTKQEGFRDCMKLFEEEISRGKNENSKLIDAQRVAKDEIAKMRDIMKHALNEATVVKEALEIARNENSHLKDMITEKDSALQRMGQEFECIKVSEAAALGSVEGLKNLLAATANFEPSKTSGSFDSVPLAKPEPAITQMKEPKRAAEPAITQVKEQPNKAAEPKSEFSRGENPQLANGNNKNNYAKSESLRYPPFGRIDNSGDGKPPRHFASFSSVSVRGTPHAVPSDASDIYNDDFDQKSVSYAGVLQPGLSSPIMHHKKKPMFRKFADILRRRSTSK